MTLHLARIECACFAFRLLPLQRSPQATGRPRAGRSFSALEWHGAPAGPGSPVTRRSVLAAGPPGAKPSMDGHGSAERGPWRFGLLLARPQTASPGDSAARRGVTPGIYMCKFYAGRAGRQPVPSPTDPRQIVPGRLKRQGWASGDPWLIKCQSELKNCQSV